MASADSRVAIIKRSGADMAESVAGGEEQEGVGAF
jgi:hypothetical protein